MLLNRIETIFHAIGSTVLSMSTRINDIEIRDENITKEVVIKSNISMPIFNIETKQSLHNKTKHIICMLANEKYGLELSMRDTKDLLINAYLSEQSGHLHI